MKIPRYVSITLSFAIVIAILSLPFIFGSKNSQTSASSTSTNGLAAPVSQLSFDHPLMIGKQAITVAFASTPAEQEQGLSDTSKLSMDNGMLFIFDAPTVPAFWMKDMNYPLDIIWIDSNKKIIAVSQNLDPSTYPQTFVPPSQVSYVLEVPAGFYNENYLSIGDSISF